MYRNFKTMTEIRDTVYEYESQKKDYRVDVRDLELNENRQLVVPTSWGKCPMNAEQLAWSQLFKRVGETVRGKGFPNELFSDRNTIPNDMLQGVMNHNIQRMKGTRLQDWLVRTSGDEIRSVMTTRYQKELSNKWLVDCIFEAYQDGKFKGTRLTERNVWIDRDTMRFSIECRDLPVGNDGIWSMGVDIFNNETGQGRIGIQPFTKRTSCDNSKVLTGGYLRSHFLEEGSLFRTKMIAIEAMRQAFGVAVEWADKIARTQYEQLDDFDKYVENICKANGFSDDIKNGMFKGCEGQNTRLGLSNALSYAGTHVANEFGEAYKLQTMAGAVFDDSLFGRVIRQSYKIAVLEDGEL